jgi:hypothetical protein
VLTDAGGATITISFTNPPAVGSGIFLAYADGAAANPIGDPTMADNQTSGHVYKKAVAGNDPTNGQMAALWYLEKILTSNAPYSITITNNASLLNYSLVGIGEITTSGSGISLDQVNTGTVNGTSPVTTTVTTTTVASVWVAAMTVDGTIGSQGIGTAFSGGTQFMVEQNDTLHIAAAADYKVATVSGATASYSISASHNGAVVALATFKEVISGGTTTTLSPTVGSETFGGQTPNLTLQLAPTVGSEIYGGQIPSVMLQLAPTVGSEVFSGQQPSLTQSFLLSPSDGSEIFSGLTPNMTLQFALTEGRISWDGNQPSISQSGGQVLHFNRRHGRVYYN